MNGKTEEGGETVEVDLTSEEPLVEDFSSESTVDFLPQSSLFSIERVREETRGKLATWMIWLFIGVVGTVLLMALKQYPIEQIKNVVTLIFTPVSALIGPILGFYFGSMKKS